MQSESCAYWLTKEAFRQASGRLSTRSVKKLAELITGAEALDPNEDDVDSVMLADLMSTLQQLGVSFPDSQSIGNRGRGVPGTVWVVIDRLRAREIADSLKIVVATKGYESIATHQPLNVFVQDATQAQRGIEYLLRVLAIPEAYAGVILRLN